MNISLEPLANYYETSQILLTVPQRSYNEGKHTSSDFSIKYISSQTIIILPDMNITLESLVNYYKTPLTTLRRSNNESKHTSADFSTEYSSSQTIIILPVMNISIPLSEINALRYNFSDAISTITPSPSSNFFLFTDFKCKSDDQID